MALAATSLLSRRDPVAGDHSAADGLLVDHGLVSVGRSEGIHGGDKAEMKAQAQAYKDRHAADAAAQMEWEAEARRDYERRAEARRD
jgi:hypothetical protein